MALPATSLALLLLTATMVLHDAGATTSSSIVRCYAEENACFDDDVCSDCATVIGSEYLECLENYDDEDDLCKAVSSIPCCTDEVSANDCLGNDHFEEWVLCSLSEAFAYVGEEECPTITCGGFGGESDDSGATVLTPAPVVDSDTTGSTSARDLDLTPSPTIKGGDESDSAPTTLEGVDGNGTVGFETSSSGGVFTLTLLLFSLVVAVL
ncbi:unnamed protein product [Ectocarpus sp. 8 AP-2014]